MAFFFPLCLRSARETLSGCLGSSSLSSSSTFIITCRDTRACKALQITTQKIVIRPMFDHFRKISLTSLDESVLMKLLELIMRLGTLLESLLVDQVCFPGVALILMFLRPRDVEGCLCQSYSLCLHVPKKVQGLRAVLCLMTHNTHVQQKSLLLH